MAGSKKKQAANNSIAIIPKKTLTIAGKVKKGRPSLMNISIMEPIILDQASKGKSDAQICNALGISKDAFNDYQLKSKEFGILIKKAKVMQESYWCDLMDRHILKEKDKPVIDTIAWLFNMKNRFNWKDKTELSSDKDAPLIINLDVKQSKL